MLSIVSIELKCDYDYDLIKHSSQFPIKSLEIVKVNCNLRLVDIY